MRKFLLIFAIVSLSACDNNFSSSSYDSGYEDAYTGASPRSNNSEYLSGFEEGDYDSECDYLKDADNWSEFKRLRCY